ncbi:hypothetical protein [Streptomyces sp. JJ38]|uniref:hypothetical protein n=1 Tax=Streptomyces sp. JJ38 TaxID=2738128 RepID=UPI001C574097|nr:hypothetical protein [Streptomyces sp. JJ38]MBW1596177.1 hypothetical protein [Streptomyces sp. JJ38]
MPTTLTIGRCVAVLVSLVTCVNLLVRDVDSAFVVPDALVSAALAAGAGLSARRAVPMLASAFGLASGVFTVAAFSYFAQGEVGGVLVFALICVAMTVLFSWRIGLPPGGGAPAPRPATHLHP